MQIFITGASGLVGGDVLTRLLRANGRAGARALVRSSAAWDRLAAALGPAAPRVEPVFGDITEPGLGLDAVSAQRAAEGTTHVIHCGADTRFSQTLANGRRVNRDGTAHVMEFAASCPDLRRVVHVSTAFVAGRLTGLVPETELPEVRSWVNAYEQSKHEAECVVRGTALPWVIVRPATLVCDGVDGRVTQVNAVHRALLLCRGGLAAMVPGTEDTPVDIVTTDHVAGATATLAGLDGIDGSTFHLCAGADAMPLGELLDRAFAWWGRDMRWRRRCVQRPVVTTLQTYRSFENAVAETGDARLRGITRSLSHFVPQLALPKRFDTSAARTVLGHGPPPVRAWLTAMLRDLDRVRPLRRDARHGRAA